MDQQRQNGGTKRGCNPPQASRLKKTETYVRWQMNYNTHMAWNTSRPLVFGADSTHDLYGHRKESRTLMEILLCGQWNQGVSIHRSSLLRVKRLNSLGCSIKTDSTSSFWDALSSRALSLSLSLNRSQPKLSYFISCCAPSPFSLHVSLFRSVSISLANAVPLPKSNPTQHPKSRNPGG